MPFQVPQTTENDQQKIQTTVPQFAMNQRRPGQLPVITGHTMLGQSPACLLAAKTNEEERLRYPIGTFETCFCPLDVNKLSFQKPVAISSKYF